MINENLQWEVSFSCFIYSLLMVAMVKAAIAPPPWANPKLNPCALQPRGWQLLYWPPDGKCYKIFQVGHPCPNGMELSPAAVHLASGERQIAAECRCPPNTAQFARDGLCYELFTIGPCEKANTLHQIRYTLPTQSSSKRNWGVCKQTQKCNSNNEIYWPQDGKCYLYLTKGPCSKGQLVTLGPDKIAVCKCNHRYEMRKYWSNGNGCFEHFTKGPCKEHGHMFLPDRTCGCHNLLPHHHNDTQLCYEIGTIGPCNTGEQFLLDSVQQKATCQCKSGYIRYEMNKNCYRPYTQGPCENGYILVNTTSCIVQPCTKGYLYYPKIRNCYRIGTQGPCKDGHVITFDFKTRPSVDGISFNGICHCTETGNKNSCLINEQTKCNDRNLILFNNQCYKLYSQEPCKPGAWLAVKRQSKPLVHTKTEINIGICECMPGYKESIKIVNNNNETSCIAPTVVLAEFLNKNYYLYSSNE